jgi:hypothetical protein
VPWDRQLIDRENLDLLAENPDVWDLANVTHSVALSL